MSKPKTQPKPAPKVAKPDEYVCRAVVSYTFESDFSLPGLPKGKFGTYSKIHEVRVRRSVVDVLALALKSNASLIGDLLPLASKFVGNMYGNRSASAIDFGSAVRSAVGGAAATPPPSNSASSKPSDWNAPVTPINPDKP